MCLFILSGRINIYAENLFSHNNFLYFVVSRNKVNFYDFAHIFKRELAITIPHKHTNSYLDKRKPNLAQDGLSVYSLIGIISLMDYIYFNKNVNLVTKNTPYF